jgi:hypothetical protein
VAGVGVGQLLAVADRGDSVALDDDRPVFVHCLRVGDDRSLE